MARPAEKLTWTIPEAAKAAQVSDDTMRMVVRRGDIPSLRIGRRVLIARKVLEEWIATGGRFDGRETAAS